MKWTVCMAVRGYPSHWGQANKRPRVVITDGKVELIYYRYTPLWVARFKAWRLNRAYAATSNIDDVKAERARYDAAMREMGAQ
jgi:starvation-inducible outer membrane lipoprotein